MNQPILESIKFTFEELIEVLGSFSSEEINKVPFPGSWTPGQVGDHLLKSYRVTETLRGEVKETKRIPDEKVKQMEDIFLNFDTKMKSPDFIIPTNKVIDKDRLIESINSKKNELIQLTQLLDLSQTCTSFANPGFGELTRLEWLHFIVVHTKRHIHQLRKIAEFIL